MDIEYKTKYEEKKKEEQIKKEKEEKEREERLNKIREKMENKRIKITICPCGGQFQAREQKRHEQCRSHIDFFKNTN